MIIELIFAPIFFLIEFVVGLIPPIQQFTGTVGSSFYEYIGMGLYFFGSTPFILVVSSVLFWSGIELAWSIIEWVYIKIPGVN